MDHIPGPWNLICENGSRYIVDRKGLVIAEIKHNNIIPELTQNTNEMLLISAPDLLAALEKIDANAAESVEWIRRVASAAITKATGKAVAK